MIRERFGIEPYDELFASRDILTEPPKPSSEFEYVQVLGMFNSGTNSMKETLMSCTNESMLSTEIVGRP